MTFRSWKFINRGETQNRWERFNEAMTFRSWKCCLLKHLSRKRQNPFSRAPMRFHLISTRRKRNSGRNFRINPANVKLASGHRCFATTSPLAHRPPRPPATSYRTEGFALNTLSPSPTQPTGRTDILSNKRDAFTRMAQTHLAKVP